MYVESVCITKLKNENINDDSHWEKENCLKYWAIYSESRGIVIDRRRQYDSIEYVRASRQRYNDELHETAERNNCSGCELHTKSGISSWGSSAV